MPPRALLFDFDGVLADTENIHVAAWQRTFADLGWEISDEVCARSAEVDDRQFLAEIFARRKIEGGDVGGWVARKQALTLSMLADYPRVYPGVVPLIDALRGRCRLAVVSTTWRENIATVLRASGLAEAFDCVVAKEDANEIKPDPAAYRHALRLLGIDASEAIALEDSATGLAAARAAGLRRLAVGHRLPRGDWVGDADFIADLSRPAEILAAVGLA